MAKGSSLTSEDVERPWYTVPPELLVGAVVVAQGVHIASIFIPGWRGVLEIEPVAFTTWVVLLVITLTKFLVVEAYEYLRGRELAERTYHGPWPVEERKKPVEDGGRTDRRRP